MELKSQPVDGKADKELIEILAEHFKTKKSNIKILSVQRTKRKILEVS